MFFSICVFFYKHSQITDLQGKGEDISVAPHYHFHPLHRYLSISRAITAESLTLHIASSRTRTGKSLTIKLCALNYINFFFRKTVLVPRNLVLLSDVVPETLLYNVRVTYTKLSYGFINFDRLLIKINWYWICKF